MLWCKVCLVWDRQSRYISVYREFIFGCFFLFIAWKIWHFLLFFAIFKSYQTKICIYLSEIYHLRIPKKKNNIAWKMTLFFSVAYKLIFNKVSQYSSWKVSCPLIFFKLQHICLWHKRLSFCRCQFIHVQF